MKKILAGLDKPLLFMMILYSILGLIMILSASSVTAVLRYGVSSYYFFVRQLIFIIVSFFIGFNIVLRIPTSKYKTFTPILVVGILASLVGLFFYGIISNNAQSWYRIGFFNLQPAEFAKSVLIIYMAVFYSRSLKKKNISLYYNLIPLVVSGIIFVLVAMQPDLGGALIIAGIAFLIFLIVPMERQNQLKLFKVLGILVVILAVGILYSGADILNSRQLSRLKFQSPCSRYTEDTGYQVCNGFIAIHNGGLFGVGLGNSSQKYLYLPEAHTDFIFPILVEELGAIVGILVLIGYVYILYRILKIGKEAKGNIRNMILCYGTFALIFLHLIVNLMGVLALIPLTGVPIPFLTYGGSFNINLILMLFVVLRVSWENKDTKFKKEMKNLK
jgi:cell division protein FtsW